MVSKLLPFFFKKNNEFPQLTEIPEMYSFLKSVQGVNILEHQRTDLVEFDLIPPDDPDRDIVDKKLTEEAPFDSDKESKAFGTFIGAVIGNALGTYTECQPLDYKRTTLKGFDNVKEVCVNPKHLRNWPGQYTVDAALALCIADSLLEKNLAFDGKDLRYRFLLWQCNGYNNGTKNEIDPVYKKSLDIGGATYNSIAEFIKNPEDKVGSYGKRTDENGNGTVMRLAPIPIALSGDLEKCLEYAEAQSFTTHNGIEASQCCKLLCFVTWNFLNIGSVGECKAFLETVGDNFKTTCEAVDCLAKSCQEKEENLKFQNPQFNKTIEDRNWNWKSPDFKYSPTRGKAGGIVGIYCMDVTVMALHIIYHADSFKEALLRAVNVGGDADTLGILVGMLAGALFGYEEDMKKWYLDYVAKWDERKCAIRAYKLFKLAEKAANN